MGKCRRTRARGTKRPTSVAVTCTRHPSPRDHARSRFVAEPGDQDLRAARAHRSGRRVSAPAAPTIRQDPRRGGVGRPVLEDGWGGGKGKGEREKGRKGTRTGVAGSGLDSFGSRHPRRGRAWNGRPVFETIPSRSRSAAPRRSPDTAAPGGRRHPRAAWVLASFSKNRGHPSAPPAGRAGDPSPEGEGTQRVISIRWRTPGRAGSRGRIPRGPRPASPGTSARPSGGLRA